MTAHGRWLELGAAEPAFALTAAEDDAVDQHLGECPDCRRRLAAIRNDGHALATLDLGQPSRAVEDRIRSAVYDDSVGLGRLTLVGLVALLVAALLGVTAGVGGFFSRPSDPLDLAVARPIVFDTEFVTLQAHDFRIDLGNAVLVGDDQFRASSGGGDIDHWLLDVGWREGGRERLFSLDLADDGSQWWIDRIVVFEDLSRDKTPTELRVAQVRPIPLSQPFVGDIDALGQGQQGLVRLHIGGAMLSLRPLDQAMPPGRVDAPVRKCVELDPIRPGTDQPPVPFDCTTIRPNGAAPDMRPVAEPTGSLGPTPTASQPR